MKQLFLPSYMFVINPDNLRMRIKEENQDKSSFSNKSSI